MVSLPVVRHDIVSLPFVSRHAHDAMTLLPVVSEDACITSGVQRMIYSVTSVRQLTCILDFGHHAKVEGDLTAGKRFPWCELPLLMGKCPVVNENASWNHFRWSTKMLL